MVEIRGDSDNERSYQGGDSDRQPFSLWSHGVHIARFIMA